MPKQLPFLCQLQFYLTPSLLRSLTLLGLLLILNMNIVWHSFVFKMAIDMGNFEFIDVFIELHD